jgi:hypothetical protein
MITEEHVKELDKIIDNDRTLYPYQRKLLQEIKEHLDLEISKRNIKLMNR